MEIGVGGKGWLFPSKLSDRISSGSLLGLFFVASPGGRVAFAGDLCRDLKVLAVVWTAFAHHAVDRRSLHVALGKLLQQGFVIADALPFRGESNFGV